MAEPLKTFFSAALVGKLGRDIARVEPGFPSRAFIKRATVGLEELELLERGKHIAAALGAHLPPAYPEAIRVLLRSLGPEHATDELLGVGMAPFFYLPHLLFVAQRGLDHFELSMRAQLVRSNSARPFSRNNAPINQSVAARAIAYVSAPPAPQYGFARKLVRSLHHRAHA